jgi:hypothetical protein
MRRQKTWKVRVVRKLEDWIDIQADNPLQAELLAASIPNVLSILTGMTMLGDRPLAEAPASIEDGDE